MKSILIFICLLFGIVLSYSTTAQTVTQIDFDTLNWVLPENYQIEEFEGEEALKLIKSADVFSRGTKAYLKDHEFTDGTIEFDVYCPQRGFIFVGFFFRLTTHNEEDRYELFYFRPFVVNKLGTIQYMPVNNDLIHLSCYADDIYQGAGDIEPKIWNHIKAEIEGPRAIVYVNDNEIKTVNNLGRGLSKGSIGVWVGETTPSIYFANFAVTQ